MNYKKHIYMVKLALFLLAFLLLPIQAAFAESIGMVLSVQGNVSAMREGSSVPLAVKDPVSVRDTILTGTDSKVQILLNDESSITIGPDSSLELREFADAGENSKFNAHIGQGMMRVITGRVTEANPSGFKVTTPVATVGIRGTLIVFDVTKDRTIIDFQNSSKTLLVNGANIPENNRITITGDSMTTANLPQQDKLANDSFAVNAGTGDSNISAEDTASSALTDAGSSPGNISVPTVNAIEDVMQNMPSTSIGLIAGNVINDDMLEGGFSFNVNLQSGAITNANSSGFNASNDWEWNVQGGSGAFDANGDFSINGFSGTFANAAIDPDSTSMSGFGSYKNIGDTIEGTFAMKNDAANEASFALDGSRVQ